MTTGVWGEYMIVRASAPGEIFLFGEHAVLYDKPALAAAIDLRTTVEGKKTDKNIIEITSDRIGWIRGSIIDGRFKEEKALSYDHLGKDAFQTESEKKQGVSPDAYKSFAYVIKSIELMAQKGVSGGFTINITSSIPLGSGLASSSAVCVATIGMLSSLFELNISDEEILNTALQAEIDIQGRASKVGVGVATYGGLVSVQKTGGDFVVNYTQDFPQLPVVIGYTGVHSSTKYLVNEVRKRYEQAPEMVGAIMESIGNIVCLAREKLLQGDVETLGLLMDINQGLLNALGVSSPELENLIFTARKNGAYGAKLTGAGGGGCMFALVPEENKNSVFMALKKYGRPIETTLCKDGLKIEKI